MIRFCAALTLIASLATTAWAGELRTAMPEMQWNPVIREPYRLGAAIDGSGRSVEVMTTLTDQASAQQYGLEIGRLGNDRAALAARGASLALLEIVGNPSVENMGVVLLSPDNQLGTVAGIGAAYRVVNEGHIEKIPGTVAFDGHIHTGRSHDGGESYEAVILAAATRGLDAIAITDHNEFDFARAQAVLTHLQNAKRVPQSFFLVPGEEISSADGHILAYFIHSRIDPGMSAGETIRAIHAQGGLAVAAHPSHTSGVGLENARRLPFDGVEVVSGANVLPLSMAMDLRGGQSDFGGRVKMANSDAHAASGIGVLYTRVESAPNADAMRVALLENRGAPVVQNRFYKGYVGAMSSTVGRAVMFPLLSYLTLKNRLLSAVADLVRADSLTVATNWENAVVHMGNGVYLPPEVLRLSQGTSDLQRSLKLSSISLSKGPLRFAYEFYDLSEASSTKPYWKVEARVDF